MSSLRSCLALVALTGVVVAPSIVDAAPAPPSPNAPTFHAIDLEVVDVGADKKTTTTRFSLVVAEGWGTARIESVVQPFDYDVIVRCDPSIGGKLPLSVELRRHDARPGMPANFSLTAAAVTAPSTRVAIGAIARSDGGSTEIALRAQ